MKDMAEERSAITEVIERVQQRVSRAEYFFASEDKPKDLCLKKSRECDIFIGIYKNQYGHIPEEENPENLSVTEMEYNEAKLKGIPQLIFIYRNIDNREELLTKFLQKVTNFTTGNFCNFFDNIDELKYQVLGSLVSAFKITPNLTQQENKDLDELAYRQYLKNQLQYVDFRGIPQFRTVLNVKLKDIYVAPSLIKYPLSKSKVESGEEISEDKIRSQVIRYMFGQFPTFIPQNRLEKKNTSNLPKILITKDSILESAVKINRRIVILGGPASGKTTLLKYYALSILEQEPQTLFPIFLQIRDFGSILSNGGVDLAHFIDTKISDKGLSSGFIIRHLKAGSCIVFLDGLDEVIDRSARIAVSSKIEEFIAQYGENNIVIVTSRTAGYWNAALMAGFEHFLITPFNFDQISEFIDRWTETIERHERGPNYDSEKVNDDRVALKRTILADPNIQEFARTPLLLAILCLINRQGIPIPRNKIKLYDHASEVLLQTWDLTKGLNSGQHDPVTLSSDYMLDLLKKMALWYFDNNKVLATKDELIELIKTKMTEMGITTRVANQAYLFLQSATERSGLLVESDVDQYSFYHLSFRDYFAAKEIAGQNSIKVSYDTYFAKSLHSARNQEIIPMIAASLSRDRATEFIRLILKANSPYEDILFRDLELVIECLFAGALIDGVLKKELLRKIRSLITVSRRKFLTTSIRNIYWEIASLLSTQYQDDIRSLLMTIPAKFSTRVFTMIWQTPLPCSSLEDLVRKHFNNILSNKAHDYFFLVLFLEERLEHKETLAIEIAKELILKGSLRHKDYRFLPHLIRLAKEDDGIKQFFMQILNSGQLKVKKAILAYLYSYDENLFAELTVGIKDEKVKEELKFYRALAKKDANETLDFYLGLLEGKNITNKSRYIYHFYQFPEIITINHFKKLFHIALSLASIEIETSFRILQFLSFAIKSKYISKEEIQKEITGLDKISIHHKKLFFVLEWHDRESLQLLKQMILDKKTNYVIRRFALDYYAKVMGNKKSGKEFLLRTIAISELANNSAYHLLQLKYKPKVVEKRLLQHIRKGRYELDDFLKDVISLQNK